MIDLGWLGWAFPLLFGLGFGGGAPKAPPPPPPPPMKSDAEIQAEAAKTRKLARGRKGRGASILTGDTNFLQPANDEAKTTLG